MVLHAGRAGLLRGSSALKLLGADALRTGAGVGLGGSLGHRSLALRGATVGGGRWMSTTIGDEQRSSQTSYDWVSPEAQELIAKAYNRHKALADKGGSFPPSLSVKDLEEGLAVPIHYEPKNLVDKGAYNLMRFLRRFTHAFFREKYDHHAVVLETVAAVPGIVAAMHRHLRSLRRMERDHGWINPLLEEAENERMHLLIWMQVCRPTLLERGLVMTAQGAYVLFYMTLYFFMPRAAHRVVGYLEEEAHLAYTDYLKAIDDGRLPNNEAPEIAKQYYRLPADAKIRDVVLHVRADECMHRDFNHMLSDKYKNHDINSAPAFMGEDYREIEAMSMDPSFDKTRDPSSYPNEYRDEKPSAPETPSANK